MSSNHRLQQPSAKKGGRLTLTFEYDGAVHGEWSYLSAAIDGNPAIILPSAFESALGFEVHRIYGKQVVTFDD